MRTSSIKFMRGALGVAICALVTRNASAQLPNASSAAFGMAGNFTAIARGFEAVSWNPANLSMPGRPAFSLGIGAFGGNAGLDPIDIRTLNSYGGQVVPAAVRESWVNQARLVGGERIRVDGGVTPIALSVGPIGLQVGASMYTTANLSPDAFETVLFGNAGRTGEPTTLDFTGTSVRSAAFTTGALSFAIPLPLAIAGDVLGRESFAVGVTGKYVLGNGLVVAEDAGSTLDGTDVFLRIPSITIRDSDSNLIPTAVEYNGFNAGKGMAMDLSFAWSGGPFRAGLLVENVFNTFKWDTTMLAFRPGTGSINEDVNFDSTAAYAQAPQSLRDIVEAQKFGQSIGLGAALNVMSSLTLTVDMKTQLGDENAIVIGPKSRFGVGVEWRLLPFLPIRGGVASITDGWQAGLGAGLRFLGYELGISTGIRSRGAAQETGLMIGVIGIGR